MLESWLGGRSPGASCRLLCATSARAEAGLGASARNDAGKRLQKFTCCVCNLRECGSFASLVRSPATHARRRNLTEAHLAGPRSSKSIPLYSVMYHQQGYQGGPPPGRHGGPPRGMSSYEARGMPPGADIGGARHGRGGGSGRRGYEGMLRCCGRHRHRPKSWVWGAFLCGDIGSCLASQAAQHAWLCLCLPSLRTGPAFACRLFGLVMRHWNFLILALLFRSSWNEAGDRSDVPSVNTACRCCQLRITCCWT